jgi:hypothetical protein
MTTSRSAAPPRRTRRRNPPARERSREKHSAQHFQATTAANRRTAPTADTARSGKSTPSQDNHPATITTASSSPRRQPQDYDNASRRYSPKASHAHPENNPREPSPVQQERRPPREESEHQILATAKANRRPPHRTATTAFAAVRLEHSHHTPKHEQQEYYIQYHPACRNEPSPHTTAFQARICQIKLGTTSSQRSVFK